MACRVKHAELRGPWLAGLSLHRTALYMNRPSSATAESRVFVLLEKD